MDFLSFFTEAEDGTTFKIRTVNGHDGGALILKNNTSKEECVVPGSDYEVALRPDASD